MIFNNRGLIGFKNENWNFRFLLSEQTIAERWTFANGFNCAQKV